MGTHPKITFDTFPSQVDLGKRVTVCFHYDSSKRIGGEIVRNDTEDPWITIFKLDDGRYILATECHYQPE